MLTSIYAFILIGLIVAPVPLLFVIDRMQKQKELRRLLLQFRHSGEEHNLTISSQDVLKDVVIGLDGVHRKMLVVERSDENQFKTMLINLDELSNCSVKKLYGTVETEDEEQHDPVQYLQEILLHLELLGRPPVQILFYRRNENRDHEAAKLQNKASQWATILSKLHTPLKRSA